MYSEDHRENRCRPFTESIRKDWRYGGATIPELAPQDEIHP